MSKNKLQLYRRPGSIVFVDDETDYLEMIGLVMPDDWNVELFLRPNVCLEYFRLALHQTETDLQIQQDIVGKWREGAALVPQLIQYWANDNNRYNLPQVLIVDYAMPAMNGLELLEKLSDWTVANVMLSGRADEHTAVNAFNRGLLEQFIPKQTPDIARNVQLSVKNLMNIPCATRDHIWSETLNRVQTKLIRTPAVSLALDEYAQGRWCEHVLIGNPFGILGMSPSGELEWLQLENASSLVEIAELVCQPSVPLSVRQREPELVSGVIISDIELQQSFGTIGETTTRPAFQMGSPDLLAALFSLDDLPPPLIRPKGYRQWRASKLERAIRY